MSEQSASVVFRTSSTIEADVVLALLSTHGIHAVVSSVAPQAIIPLPVSGLGEVRLAVRSDVAARAARVIAEFRREVSDELTRLRDEFRAVEEVLGYHFEDQGLLEHALTHRSRVHEDVSGGVRDNESLEFLGDAVLGFVIADRLFRECPDWDEGQKSKAKSMIVSSTTLARVGEELGLGDHLLLGRGEEKTGGRRKRSLIADTFEAVVAAIYLDGGIGAAEAFLDRCFRPQLDAVRTGARTPELMVDHKSALQEYLLARNRGLPEYRLVGETGPAHRRAFETEVYAEGEPLGRGVAQTKKESAQRAAERALHLLAEHHTGAAG